MSRVTADPLNPDVALPNSEVIVLGTPAGRLVRSVSGHRRLHAGGRGINAIGTLRFCPDGTLFVGNGDGASQAFADPNALRAQNLDSLSGKILRIDDDGSAPAEQSVLRRHELQPIEGLGLRRSPSDRFALHPTTYEPWAGDVGWETRKKSIACRAAPTWAGPVSKARPRSAQFDALFTQCSELSAGAVLPPFHSYEHSPRQRGIRWRVLYGLRVSGSLSR